jgi:flagellar motor protein MotB
MAKGGGAWKVAYADFVTAMMAFFLVMWICAQDQKIKRAVADYFSNPNGIVNHRSQTPNRSGAMFEGVNTGPVPHSESVALGRGRGTYSPKERGSRLTKVVNDWMHSDAKVVGYWRNAAAKQRDLARRAKSSGEKIESVEQAATNQLAQQLKDELMRDIPGTVKGLHQDLLFETLSDVNWIELAEDLLGS